MNNIVIGIEGLVGSGKTSICKELLKYIPNSIILHGGNLYRGIVYALMSAKHINISELKNNIKNVNIRDLMNKLGVEFKIEDRETVIYINGKKIDDEVLQSKDASMAVSIAGGSADNSAFYGFARSLIDMYKQKFNVIVSGRDLMQIYPNLDYHLFIEASLEERIQRKLKQYGENANYEEIKKNIVARDELQEKAGYYKIYENTIKIDVTDCKTVEESTKKVLQKIHI
jgi:cytidylate kinase